jgi:hypothetical protein
MADTLRKFLYWRDIVRLESWMQWTQVYDPFGHWWWSMIVAAPPIIAL